MAVVPLTRGWLCVPEVSLSTSQQSWLLEFAPVHSSHRSVELQLKNVIPTGSIPLRWSVAGVVALLKSLCLLLPLLYLFILMAALSLPGTWLSVPHRFHEVSLPVPDFPLPSFAQWLRSMGSKLCILYQVWAVAFQRRAPTLWKTGGFVQPLKSCA